MSITVTASPMTARQRSLAMAAICTAVAMATLDTAIANTALPTIAADLHAEAADSVWVVNAYQLAVIATLLPLAALGDVIGARRVYIAGIVVFTAASLACALAWSLPSLTIARVAQGFGASGVMSVNAALLRFIHPPERLGRGIGLNALVVAVAFAIGPTVASAILSIATWPWLFAVNLPFGIAAAIGSAATLPATTRSGHRFDRVGALLCAVLFAALILGLGDASHAAPPWRTEVSLAVAACALILLLGWQRGSRTPILPLDLFRRPLFALSSLTSIGAFATQGLAFVSLPFLFQTVLGRTQVETGLLMTPWPVFTALAVPISGRLSDRISPGLLGGIGLLVLAAGMVLMALLPANPTALDVGWRMALCGTGFGFFQAPNQRALLSSAPRERSGSASGIVAVSRLLGQTIGAALVAACFGLALGPARTVVNVGAGAGSYEPTDRDVTAVEPSAAMRAQRPAHLATAIDATAEALPFADGSFDAAMATVTIHQWSDTDQGLRELRRVSRGPVVILTFDGDALDRFWLADYVPELIIAERRRYPAIDHVRAVLGGVSTVTSIPVPIDCVDGFTEAYYARPERFLDPAVRRSQSAWGFVDADTTDRVVERFAVGPGHRLVGGAVRSPARGTGVRRLVAPDHRAAGLNSTVRVTTQ